MTHKPTPDNLLRRHRRVATWSALVVALMVGASFAVLKFRHPLGQADIEKGGPVRHVRCDPDRHVGMAAKFQRRGLRNDQRSGLRYESG